MNDFSNNTPSGGRYPYNMPGYVPPQNGQTQDIRPVKEKSPSRRLFELALLEGGAFLCFLLISKGFGSVLWKTSLADIYNESLEASYLIDMLYTFLCIGLPFSLLYLFLKKSKAHAFSMPLGGVYSGYSAFLLIFAGFGLCLLGSVFSNLLAAWADSIGFGFTSYYDALEGEPTPTSAFGVFLMILGTALTPALVEEFAFRGVIMQPLRKYGDWFAIITSALLFGLMHGNMTQAPFAVVAGLALGYCAVVSGSLWIGILIHFLNNLLSVGFALLSNAYDASSVTIVSDVTVYGFIGIGLLALVFFALRCPSFWRLRAGTDRDAKKYYYYIAPTVLISVGIMLWIVWKDIQFH